MCRVTVGHGNHDLVVETMIFWPVKFSYRRVDWQRQYFQCTNSDESQLFLIAIGWAKMAVSPEDAGRTTQCTHACGFCAGYSRPTPYCWHLPCIASVSIFLATHDMTQSRCPQAEVDEVDKEQRVAAIPPQFLFDSFLWTFSLILSFASIKSIFSQKRIFTQT